MPGETQKVSCADRVAERNIQRVVMGMLDPPIDGNGAKKLLKAGKSVEQFHPELGIEARDVNREYMRDAIDVDPQLAAPHSFDIYTAAKLLGLQSSHQSIPLFAHDLAARTKKQQIPHKDTRDYTFWIGCKGTSDRARLAFSTKATSKLPLLFRRLIVAGTPGTGGMPKVADLNLAAGGRASDVVPLETTPEGLALLVLFDPPIGQNPAPWWVSYDWPRLWDPYRDSGTDYGTFEVGKSCSAIKITIRFDAGFKATPDTFSGRYPEVGDLYSATEDGEKVLSWTVEDPEPGRTYSYRIDSDGRPTC